MNPNYIKATLVHATLSAVLAMNASSSNQESKGSNHMQGKERLLRSIALVETEEKEFHIRNTPKEINVDPRSTYDEKFMALMSSPCRPEYDGFFGATSGDPIRIQYGFQLEVQPLSAIMDILDSIEDKIVDSVLQSSFPEMCGLQHTRNGKEPPRKLSVPEKSKNRDKQVIRSLSGVDGHPSGFRFLKFEEVEKCIPKANEVNFCGIFTGLLLVYGKHQNGEETTQAVMSYIHKVLDTSAPHDLHSEVSFISSVDQFSAIEGGYVSQFPGVQATDIDGRRSRLDILLIIISGLIVVAIVYYFCIQWNERRYDDTKLPIDGLSSPRKRLSHEFIDEPQEFEPYMDETAKNGFFL